MDSFEFITYEFVAGSAKLTINRPELYNAMNRKTKLELIEAINLANADQEVHSLILTGKGKAFSSGQDLQDRTVRAQDQTPVDLGQTLGTEWNPLVNAIRNSKKLVIGAINGVCAGAGCSVALACDFLVSKPGVKFVSGFAQIGLCPDAGVSHKLVRTLGHQRALAFALLGEPLFAEDLLQLGLLNAIVEEEMDKALDLAQKINQLPPLAVEKIKENFHVAMNRPFEESMEKELEAQRFLGYTQDYQEGLKAFFEKRKPQFQGK